MALAASLAAIGVYYAAESSLRREVDQGLERRAERVAELPSAAFAFPPRPLRAPNRPDLPGAGAFGQIRGPDGEVMLQASDEAQLPLDGPAQAVLDGEQDQAFSNATVDGRDVRVLNIGLPTGGIVQLAAPVDDVDSALSSVRGLLVGIIALATLLAGVLAVVVSRPALGPVRQLRRASERVTETGDLTERVPVQGRDDVAGLATSFNSMLDALETSEAAQRQLVTDASHELRTPLTSIRTNAELLASSNGRLAAKDREQALVDIHDQSREMTTLIEELIDLARASEPRQERALLALEELVAEVVARAARRTRTVRIETALEPTPVVGSRPELVHAVGNLLDNAVKWSPDGGTVSVTLEHGVLTVADEGPGIDPEDLPHVFARFYRAPSARDMPGSGLGLAIVQKVATDHGGRVLVESAPGRGARFELDLSEIVVDRPAQAVDADASG